MLACLLKITSLTDDVGNYAKGVVCFMGTAGTVSTNAVETLSFGKLFSAFESVKAYICRNHPDYVFLMDLAGTCHRYASSIYFFTVHNA